MMEFDRPKAIGMRLNIPAGTAVRFEPGEEKKVELVAFGGKQIVVGFSRLTEGIATDKNIKAQSVVNAAKNNFKSTAL